MKNEWLNEGMKIQYLVVWDKICFDFIKFIKFANYFIKVLYGFGILTMFTVL